MLDKQEIKSVMDSKAFLEKMEWLYCCDEAEAKEHEQRFCDIIANLEKEYGPHSEIGLFSAPGRTEIGGNHTDHQHGCVLAGSVNIDMIAAAGYNPGNVFRLTSEGYDPCEIDFNDLQKKPEEENTTISLLRGICKAFQDRGAVLKGLDVYVASNVPKGSGVSSSAAFETLIGVILNELCMGDHKVDAVEIAKIGQWAENVYFGKPCGLMDQMASSVGSIIGIDFKDPSAPVISKAAFDLHKEKLALCIIDSGADHADLTDEYAAVPAECKSVAKYYGYEVLRDLPQEVFWKDISGCRKECGDRAVLRAIHFFHENKRAQDECKALEEGDYNQFLQLVNASGDSSWQYLQNITPAGAVKEQAVGITIALAKELLQGKGAVRVHGGGFAGTVQAFVPLEMLKEFHDKINDCLGEGHCHIMSIRPVGGLEIL